MVLIFLDHFANYSLSHNSHKNCNVNLLIILKNINNICQNMKAGPSNYILNVVHRGLNTWVLNPGVETHNIFTLATMSQSRHKSSIFNLKTVKINLQGPLMNAFSCSA